LPPDTSKFLQPDQFNNALANLALGTDPLTQNRYSLAGGNPLSFIEWNGHDFTPDGSGGSDPSPTPPKPNPSVGPSGFSMQLACTKGGCVQTPIESQQAASQCCDWSSGAIALWQGLTHGPTIHDYAETERNLPGIVQIFDIPIFQTLDQLTNGHPQPTLKQQMQEASDPETLISVGLMTGRIGPKTAHASTPVGSKNAPINVPEGTNAPRTINGLPYSGHALDRMQGQGIPASVVVNTLEVGDVGPGNRRNTVTYYDPVNDITVVQNYTTNRIVTVHYGAP